MEHGAAVTLTPIIGLLGTLRVSLSEGLKVRATNGALPAPDVLGNNLVLFEQASNARCRGSGTAI